MALVRDAWIREAQEASKLVEDIECRIKNKNLSQEQRVKDTAKSKLLEVGVKLDQLESLLLNPPSKPILTDEDLLYRWKMLSEFRVRTGELAQSLYSLKSAKRQEGFLFDDVKETNRITASYDEDDMKMVFTEDNQELLKPLVIKQTGSSDDPTTSLRKVFEGITLIVGAAAFLFVLFNLVSII